MNSKRLISFILASLLLASAMVACGDKKDNASDNNSDIGDASVPTQSDTVIPDEQTPTDEQVIPDDENTGAEITEENTEPEAPEQQTPPEVLFFNKLTGLPTTEQLSNQRPVAIMFNNIKAALPQHGIADMDVVYEAIVEGSITRLLGVTTNWQELSTLGSIRSSRDYYIDFSDAHNAIYIHAGGSDIAYGVLSQRRTDNIDGVNGNAADSRAFYRDQERRKKGVSLEHTMFTTGERLTKAIADNKFKTTLKDGFVSPLKFADVPSDMVGEDATYVYVPFSTYAQSYFDYNSETGVYDKGQYVSSKSSLDKHDSPHIDGNTNAQLAFDNIIIIYTSYRTIDDKGRQAVNFTGSGDGYYFSDGKGKKIKWERATRTGGYTLYEADGTTELLLNKGKTYIGVVRNGTEITYK